MNFWKFSNLSQGTLARIFKGSTTAEVRKENDFRDSFHGGSISMLYYLLHTVRLQGTS